MHPTENKTTRVLITGAAGNLGGLLSHYLSTDENCLLNLMVHNKDISPELRNNNRVTTFKADLANKETLFKSTENVDVIVHFAGVLFMNDPEKFLPVTNTLYFKNLLEVALTNKVKRIILISFPHVEGETSPQSPAKGSLTGNPVSMHATTRLAEERLLVEMCKDTGTEPVSLRVGMVYGKGILMIDAAHWFSKYWLLGIWKEPTWIHLISTEDFLSACKNAALNDHIEGIYHIGDNGVQTLQEFLDEACRHWKTKKPWRMPVWMIMTAARFFELCSRIFGVRSPLTCDFIKIGMVSYYGDTSRMKQELLPVLKYNNFREGIKTL